MSIPALRIENLSKQNGHLLALDGLDLEVPAGEVFGFLGPNGAGKPQQAPNWAAAAGMTAIAAALAAIGVAAYERRDLRG